jgi:hypothetical protein
MRRLALSLTLLAVAALWAADLKACGDKLLLLGQGARISQRTKNPRSILLYKPAGLSKNSGVSDSESTYKRLGHKVLVAKDSQQLIEKLKSEKVDFLIADPSDKATMHEALQSTSSAAKLIEMTVPARAKEALYASLVEGSTKR